MSGRNLVSNKGCKLVRKRRTKATTCVVIALRAIPVCRGMKPAVFAPLVAKSLAEEVVSCVGYLSSSLCAGALSACQMTLIFPGTAGHEEGGQHCRPSARVRSVGSPIRSWIQYV